MRLTAISQDFGDDARRVAVPMIERLLVHAAREIQPLGALTPLEARAERERMVRDLESGGSLSPRWTYAPRPLDDVRRALDAAAETLAPLAEEEDAARLYVDRVRELALEAALCAAAGTDRIGALAAARYACADPSAAKAASRLARRWLDAAAREAKAPAGAPLEALVASDSSDPRSLLSHMRAVVGRLRLPFSVVASPTLAPLAATGDGVVYVAAGRLVGEDDARRTVIHEIAGHVAPRVRAAKMRAPIFRFGSARGVDHQEGRALVVEERAGHLRSGRRRHLAARHRAVEAMAAGASFADVARWLAGDVGMRPIEAVVIAERVFRGSTGSLPGIGRERVYLESFVHVRRHLAAHPGDEHVMACGQISAEGARLLRASFDAEQRERGGEGVAPSAFHTSEGDAVPPFGAPAAAEA